MNLAWALERMLRRLLPLPVAERAAAAWHEAAAIADEDVATNAGHRPPRPAAAARTDRRAQARRPVNVLTHCNAGWLATVDWGTALAPIYQAHDAGHAGACLGRRDPPAQPGRQPHRLGAGPARRAAHGDRRQRRRPPDAARPGRPGHRRQPTASRASGDVCNKIGTYLKALAARDNGVPFYVALPLSTLDWRCATAWPRSRSRSAARARSRTSAGRAADGEVVEVQLAPDGSAAANPAFDVTPARLVTGADHRARRGAGRSRDALRGAGGAGAMNARRDRRCASRRCRPCRKLDALGLNRGSTGNLSLRCARGGVDGMLITPTGMGADDLRAAGPGLGGLRRHGAGRLAALVGMALPPGRPARARRPAGGGAHPFGRTPPRWPACERELPAFHYMVAVAGGDTMPLRAVPHLRHRGAVGRPWRRRCSDRNACLLAHHGLVAAGATLAQAMKIAIEIESLCEVYLKALAVGEPALLSAAQMAEVLDKFSSYGRSRRR